MRISFSRSTSPSGANKAALGAVLAAAFALSACQSGNVGSPRGNVGGPNASALTPVATIADIDGIWQPIKQDGTELGYQALFRGGQFASYDRNRTDPNELLAKGTYQASSITQIKLDFVGASSGRNSADCQLISKDRMNCTLASGTPLFFKKATATS
ncbi:MAG: hypothetical protein AAGF28_11270 [Pseudomonadota bacterium]